MPDLRVEVDPDTADALQTESELLGFDGPETYLSWIVENRAAIEQGTESAELLEAYRCRLAALEERLAAIGVDADDVYADADDVNAAADGVNVAADDVCAGAAEVSADVDDARAGVDGGPAAVEDGRAHAEAATIEATDGATGADAGGSDAEASEDDRAVAAPTVGGAPATDAAEAVASSAERDDASADSLRGAPDADDGDAATARDAAGQSSVTDVEVTSMHLRPERVQRVDGDAVGREAGQLSDVETQRVDELSRRAVAQTRSQLDRDVETGLSYSSSPAFDSDVRPGEDLADLDAIDVPGRSEDVVAERREVVGRALAFLRDEERARRSDFVAALYEDHPAGYETADGWWRCVREGLQQVDAVDGGHVWEYVG